MLTKSSDPHHTISKKVSFRPKTGLRIKTKNPQESSFKDVPETQTPTIGYIKSTSKPSSPRSVLSPQMQRVSSPLLVKSQLFFKRSLSPKEIPIGEKVFKFKVAPTKQEYGSSSPSEEGKRMVDLRNKQVQTQTNNFTQEVQKVEQIRKIKEPQIPMTVFTSQHGSKRGSLNEAPVNDAFSLQKIATEGEEIPPQHLAQSSGFDFSTISFIRDRQKSASMVIRGGVVRRFASPTAQEYKLSSYAKPQIAEDNHLLFTEDAEIENRANEKEKEIKKSNHPVSQAMFRMREFKKAKSIIMNKNKRKLSITTETTNTNSFASKIPSPRPLESPYAKTRPFFSPQGKAKFVFDKPLVENISQSDNNNIMKEFERNRSQTIQNFLNTEKTMTTLPDEGLTIRVTKSLEGQLPIEDENQTGAIYHFAPKSKASINSPSNEFRRKSELVPGNKTEKYSMKRFLKLTEGSNNSYNTLNSIESPTLPKIPEMKEMKEKKIVKELNRRKPSLDIDISLVNSEEKIKRASPKSVTVNPSSPHRKSLFRPPTATSRQSQQPELQQKQSPKFSPLLKPLESPHLRATKRNENNVIKRKKSGNPLEEIDELSQISIKQFEMNNDSFELDNFDFIRKTSIKLKQV